MDKPKSLTMREYLVRTLAPKLMISEKVIDAVVVHQFQEANTALSFNDTIEISGFGKFIFNTKKAHKTMELYYSKERKFKEMLQNPNISEAKRNSVENKLKNNDLAIEQLKPKLNDKSKTNIRGLEEQPNPTFSSEGDD